MTLLDIFGVPFSGLMIFPLVAILWMIICDHMGWRP